MRGKFITLEGIEGAGKTSALSHAQELLEEVGLQVHVTREPGGTPVAERIRDVLLEKVDELVTPMTELLLMFAARAQHVHRVIEPRLAEGTWVLCDRFTDSTYAYQGEGRGISRTTIRWLEDFAQKGLRPDLTLLLDVEPLVGLKRARGGAAGDRIEQENLDFFERVRAGYLQMARREPKRFHVIEAKHPQPDVLDQVRWTLSEFLNELAP